VLFAVRQEARFELTAMDALSLRHHLVEALHVKVASPAAVCQAPNLAKHFRCDSNDRRLLHMHCASHSNDSNASFL
jgi:hypothetical protein